MKTTTAVYRCHHIVKIRCNLWNLYVTGIFSRYLWAVYISKILLNVVAEKYFKKNLEKIVNKFKIEFCKLPFF